MNHDDINDTTLITNFVADDLEVFQEAVKLYGNNKVYISNNAYDCYGDLIDGHYALHCTDYIAGNGFTKEINEVINYTLGVYNAS